MVGGVRAARPARSLDRPDSRARLGRAQAHAPEPADLVALVLLELRLAAEAGVDRARPQREPVAGALAPGAVAQVEQLARGDGVRAGQLDALLEPAFHGVQLLAIRLARVLDLLGQLEPAPLEEPLEAGHALHEEALQLEARGQLPHQPRVALLLRDDLRH